MEDKISAKHNKASQNDIVERKNRRLSTHDERRRQSVWIETSDVNTMTDPIGECMLLNSVGISATERQNPKVFESE